MTLASNLSEQATTVLQESYLVTKDKKKETEEYSKIFLHKFSL